ncbi:MAG TPA: hypothetical protein DCE23_05975 [Firmicutes bacterium]|nr:hypothetical protein [Bacillota bacterium]
MEIIQSRRDKIITGAKKVTACIALAGLLTGGLGLVHAASECTANSKIDSMCPMAQIETALFGKKAGMEHQVHDIERYGYNTEDGRVYTTNVTYMPAGSYTVPEGYILKTDEEGKPYGYKELEVLYKTYINEFGQEQKAYFLPEGGVIGQAPDGKMYGYKKVSAIPVEDDTISYAIVRETKDGQITKNAYFVYDSETEKSATVSEYPVLRKTK